MVAVRKLAWASTLGMSLADATAPTEQEHERVIERYVAVRKRAETVWCLMST